MISTARNDTARRAVRLTLADAGRRSNLWAAFPLLAALLAVVPIVAAMPHGLDLSFDSIQYLSAGRNLLAGHGLSVFDGPGRFRPMTHFPPLYPVLLAAFGALFGDVARGAWILNLVATAGTVLLVARLARRLAGENDRAGAHAAAIAALATATANDLAVNGAMLWSEPLFILIVVATAVLLVRTNDRESGANTRDDASLTFAALLAGASALTRYAGIGIIGGGVLSLLLASRLSLRARVRRAALFGTISTVPLGGWLLYNQSRAGTTMDRELSVHVISRDELWVGLVALSHWFFAYDPTDGYGMLAALVVAGIIAFIVRETLRASHAPRETRNEEPSIAAAPNEARSEDTRHATLVVAILILTYGALLLASIMFAEHAASLDERLLSPALPLVVAMAAGTACSLLRARSAGITSESFGRGHAYPRLRAIAIAALIVSLGDQVAGLASWVRHMPERSLGLTSLSRSADELLGVVRTLPRNAHVYSNMPYMTYAFADRVVSDLPMKISQTSLKANPHFLSELQQVAAATDGNSTYLVFFDSPFHPPFYTTAKDAIVAFPTAEKHFFLGGEVFVIAAH